MSKILNDYNSNILFDDSTPLFFIKDNIDTIWRELEYIKNSNNFGLQVKLSIHMRQYPIIQQLVINPFIGKIIVINPEDYSDITELLNDVCEALEEIHPE